MPASKATPGFYGWKLVAAIFLIYLVNTAFPYYGGSVLNAYMAEDLALSRSALGLGFSVFLLFVGLSSPVVGVLVNRLGVRIVLLLGGVTLAIGAALMGLFVTSPFQYYLFFGGLCGIGFSLGGVIPVQSAVTYWFRRRKPLAMSIVLCASGIGSVLSIPLLNAVVTASGGNWRMGWFVVAVACAAAAAIAGLFVRNRPEDLGQTVDGDPPEGAAARSGNGIAKPAVHHTSELWTVAEALRQRAYWLMVYATCAFTMVFNLCIAHGVVHLKDRGIDAAFAATSVGLVVFSSVIGRLLTGAIGSRIEPRLSWCAGLVLMGLGMQTLAIADSGWHVFVYAFAIGAGFGVCYVSMANMLGNYFGIAAFAPLLGMVTTVTCLVGALSPALAGIIYDSAGTYALAFTALLAITAIAIIAIPMAKPPRRSQET